MASSCPFHAPPITSHLIPLHCRCIFAVTVTGLNGRSTRILSTLVPEQGSSRSSWTWRGMRSRSTSVGRGSSASAWHGRDQVRFEGSLPRLRSLVSREHSNLSVRVLPLFSFLSLIGDRPFSYFANFDTPFENIRNRIFGDLIQNKNTKLRRLRQFFVCMLEKNKFFWSLFKEFFIRCNPLLSLLIIAI